MTLQPQPHVTEAIKKAGAQLQANTLNVTVGREGALEVALQVRETMARHRKGRRLSFPDGRTGQRGRGE